MLQRFSYYFPFYFETSLEHGYKDYVNTRFSLTEDLRTFSASILLMIFEVKI